MLTLQMMVVLFGVAAHEAHDLILAENVFSPAFLDEAHQIPVNGRQA